MKKGLILEGGAMRGMFTAGVMDVLMENNIEFDGLVGVSAGAVFGCNYKSKQIGRVIRYNKRFCKDKRYGNLCVLLKTGNYYSKEFCYEVVPTQYDLFDYDTYEQNPMEFHIVTTNVETGKPVYHIHQGRNDHGFEWLRASGSMPFVSEMVEIDGIKMLDGGVADSVPIRYFQDIGYDKNIVVLTQPYDYRKSPNKLVPLAKLKYRKYPEFIETLANRHNHYNETLDYIFEQEEAGSILVIRPKTALPVKRTEKDPDKLDIAYQMGRQVAIERLEEIIEYLK